MDKQFQPTLYKGCNYLTLIPYGNDTFYPLRNYHGGGKHSFIYNPFISIFAYDNYNSIQHIAQLSHLTRDYRNWYQYWGHCCLINDLGSSPQPSGCGELPRSLMRQQWPKLRYHFLFYHDETKLVMNKQILSIWMLKFVPKLSLVTAWLHVHTLRSCDLIVSPW